MVSTARRIEGELPAGLTVTDFLDWAKARAGRFELHDGNVVAMAPERVGHARVKFAVQRSLHAALQSAKSGCRVLPDGVAVHVSEKKWYEPDALVYCGAEPSADDLTVRNPIIVVEVVSPSTAQIDETSKLIGYFTVPSIEHYLIIDPDGLPLVHHQRQGDGTILTRLIAGGSLRLDPPGIDIDVAEFFTQ